MKPSQSLFRNAILDAQRPVPNGLSDGHAAPAGRRFDVYRNNVILSLTDALCTAFPLVRKLLGGESFDRLAGLYVRAHPPQSPLMMFYGTEFPAFIEGFKPLSNIGYLADCARLDLAQREAYHAADARPCDPGILQQEDPDQMLIALAPATRLVRSRWPLYDIWRYNNEEDAPKPRAIGQSVLVTRPGFDPVVHPVTQAMADWLDRLDRGGRLGAATDAIIEMHPAFDLAEALSLALTSGALTGPTAKESV